MCYIGYATHLYIEIADAWYALVKSVPLVRFTCVGIVQMCCNIEPRLRFYDAQLRLRIFFISGKTKVHNYITERNVFMICPFTIHHKEEGDVCCFMNFHEKETAENLEEHLDRELQVALGHGCLTFVTGTKYPEDAIFAESVLKAAKAYTDSKVELICIAPKSSGYENPNAVCVKYIDDENYDEKLRNLFIWLSDWDIYSYFAKY